MGLGDQFVDAVDQFSDFRFGDLGISADARAFFLVVRTDDR